MGKNRPIVVATLGYIIGIIWGLYLKVNIALFYIIISIFLVVAKHIKNRYFIKKQKFKIISIQRIFRYIKLIFNFKSLIIIIICSIISNIIVNDKKCKYENLYSTLENVNVIAKVVNNGITKEYKTTYKIKVEKINGDDKYKSTYLYLDINSKININLKFGDYISLEGIYMQPSKASNYKGFDYAKYLRTQKVYGTINLKKVEILKENSNSLLFTVANNISLKIKEITLKNLKNENANLLLGILFGYKDGITEEMQQNFSESNISHILAVSGQQFTYIIVIISNIFEKSQGKQKSKFITIFFIIIYMFLTDFSPSVIRAGIMGIISLIAKLTYNKNDIWTSMAISILCTLIYNPFLVNSAGVLLSYGGTIGIIIFQKTVTHFFQNIKAKSKIYKRKATKSIVKIINYIQNSLSINFAVQLTIAPIIARMFNTISISFFITNFLVNLIMSPIIILGILFIISNYFFPKVFVSNIIKFFLESVLDILISISKLGKILPFSKIYIIAPKIWQILIYYLMIFILSKMYLIIQKKKQSAFEKRLINFKNLIKHLIRKKRKKILLVIICLIIILSAIKIFPKDLKIYFIDVGQGDSTLIITPTGKTILIDGGGSESYDVGKNVLLPYLLARGITKIDNILISHFDSDHVLGIFTILEEIKVDKVIISKQKEVSTNFQRFLEITSTKNIKIQNVKAGDRLILEKDLFLYILWPTEKMKISENSLNNNSIVAKIKYKNFSILFTADIEEVAEQEILSLYAKNLKILNSTVLKVGHHGSKTSSTKEFLEAVQPKISLIGVGAKNNFGHPNEEVLKRIINLRSKNLSNR